MRLLDVVLGDPDAPACTPSLRRDLRSGRAGAGVRLGLSLAAATGLMVGFLLIAGAFDMTGRIGPEHIVPTLIATAMTWCGVVTALWWTYRPKALLVRTVIAVLGIWLVAIPTAVLIGDLFGGGFLVVATIFTAITMTVGLVVIVAYKSSAGRSMVDDSGQVAVRCPTCGYSMVGLATCSCPECGTTFTIDEIIRRQDYAVLRPERR